MRAHILGTGFVLGLVVTAFGSPAAWADIAADHAADETVTISETAPFPAAPGEPDVQMSQVPRGAPETGDGGRDADGGQHRSVSLLGLGMAIGAAAGGGAIVWREVRR